MAGWKSLARRIRGPFAIIAVSPQTAVAVTDLMGSRPVFRNESGTAPVFGDSLASVTSGRKLVLRTQAVARYLAFGNVGGVCSFVDGVRTLPGAAVSIWDGSQARTESWFDWAAELQPVEAPVEELEKQFLSLFQSWVETRLPKTGQIALLLSGGTDSGLLAALLQPLLGDRLLCITQDFLLRRYSERDDAQETARRVGARMHVASIGRRGYFRAFSKMNSPSQNMPVYLSEAQTLYCLSQVAMNLGIETIIHGWNADFLFLGQGHFFNGFPPDGAEYLRSISRLKPEEKMKWVAPRPAAPTELSVQLLAALAISKETYGYWVDEFVEWRIRQLEGLAQILDLPKLQQASCQLDFGVSWQLEPGAVMQALPGCRLVSPFIDSEIVRFGFRLPTGLFYQEGQSKYFLRRLFKARTELVRVKRPASLSPLRYWRYVPSLGEHLAVSPSLRALHRHFLLRNLVKLGALYTPLTKLSALGRWMQSHQVSLPERSE
jgi:asparagine synthase (glutamine-hydrolysing)